jgi:beta-galactosidase
MTGYADEIDLIYRNSRNENFEKISGLKWEELDGLYPEDENHTYLNSERILLKGMCELNEAETADVLSTYQEDFYKGHPVITKHKNNYHIAANTDSKGYAEVFSYIFSKENINKIKFSGEDLITSLRSNDEYNYYFIMNFKENTEEISLNDGSYYDILNKEYPKSLVLEKYDFRILRESKGINN